MSSIVSHLLFLGLFSWASATCNSFGWDFVNGGGPYYVDTRSSEPFSFGSGWQGCTPDDSQGDITPILVDPNFDDYSCSDIPTQPDNTEMISYCNVTTDDPSNVLLKSQMTSGDWIVVLEGLTFAWMRQFSIIAGPPKIVTETPTATFSVTETPTSTKTTTVTSVDITTLDPSTTTVPSTTLIRTITTTPKRVTVTSTSTLTRTKTASVFTKTTTTKTITTSCQTQTPVRDPTCTIRPSKASLKASEITPTAHPNRRYQPHGKKFGHWVRDALPEAANFNVAKRSPDACTSTTLASNAVSTTTTVTAPAVTEVITTDTLITSTVTPPPVTAYSGKAKTTITSTAPTPTRTINTRTFTTTTTTQTVVATMTSTTKVPPSGVICKPK